MSLLAKMQLDVASLYRLALLEAVIHEYGLTTIYRYVQKAQFDTGNAYHHPDHCIRVAWRFVELMTASGWRLKHDYARGIVAALFHDFGHTGKGPDINKSKSR
jgi:HD superfamily phosphodiesterase